MTGLGFRGAPAPDRFNMAGYCLAPAAHRPDDRLALVVVHDAHADATTD